MILIATQQAKGMGGVRPTSQLWRAFAFIIILLSISITVILPNYTRLLLRGGHQGGTHWSGTDISWVAPSDPSPVADLAGVDSTIISHIHHQGRRTGLFERTGALIPLQPAVTLFLHNGFVLTLLGYWRSGRCQTSSPTTPKLTPSGVKATVGWSRYSARVLIFTVPIPAFGFVSHWIVSPQLSRPPVWL